MKIVDTICAAAIVVAALLFCCVPASAACPCQNGVCVLPAAPACVPALPKTAAKASAAATAVVHRPLLAAIVARLRSARDAVVGAVLTNHATRHAAQVARRPEGAEARKLNPGRVRAITIPARPRPRRPLYPPDSGGAARFDS